MNYLYSAVTPSSSNFETHPSMLEEPSIISNTLTVTPLIPNNRVLCDSKQTYHKLLGIMVLSYSSGGYSGSTVVTSEMQGDTEYVSDSTGTTENVVTVGSSVSEVVKVNVDGTEKSNIITMTIIGSEDGTVTGATISLSDTSASFEQKNINMINGVSGGYVAVVGSGTIKYTKRIFTTEHVYFGTFNLQIYGNSPRSIAAVDRKFIMDTTESQKINGVVIPVTNGTSASTRTVNGVYFKCINANQNKVEVE